MEADEPETKKQKLIDEFSKSVTPLKMQPTGQENHKTNPKVCDENFVATNAEKQSENFFQPLKKIAPSENKGHNMFKADSRNSLTNGSGQKLESIIGRLCSDRKVSSFDNDDEEPVLCKADASTQTFPDFVKIVKCLVLQRMKQLEQSLIGGAVADSVLNGKLAELHRENKELRDKTKRLQDKVDTLLNIQKQEEEAPLIKDRDVIDNMALQAMPTEGGTTSPIRRQSAVVSPYNVNGLQAEVNQEIISQLEVNRPRKDVAEKPVRTQGPPSSQLSQNSTIIAQNSTFSNSTSHPQVSRQGPQVKYVPHKIPGSQVLPGGSTSQFIHLGQGNLAMQRLQPQHLHSSGNDHGMRHAVQQVVYTAPPIQVTGPRMSTLPPQPQQVQQQHPLQRPMLSPNNSGIILAQPSVPSASSVRLQGQSGQTMHYVPQGIMPGYVTQVQPNFSQDGHRIIAQVPNSRDFRGHNPSGRNAIHNVNDFRVRPSQNAPPPYQSMARVELAVPPKLQVNITVSGNGIVLSWDFEADPPPNPPAIECYHLFASQDSPNPPTKRSEWKKIGVVKALPLPMACTLTQFVSGNSYHFAVLAIDVHGREGQMSNPCTVRLNK